LGLPTHATALPAEYVQKGIREKVASSTPLADHYGGGRSYIRGDKIERRADPVVPQPAFPD
jgi:hypothetical protein